jgi:hypothetical protein
MYRFWEKVLYFFVCSCLVGSGVSLYASADVDSHLSEYSCYNITPHDNIDDEVHAHKHSEEGEEHEHKHKHTNISQNEISFLSCSDEIVSISVGIETNNCFYEKTFISSPHPFEIFRPPIV